MKDRIVLVGLLASTLLLLAVNAGEIRRKPLEKENHLIFKLVSHEEMDKILQKHPDAVEMTAVRDELKGRSMNIQGRNLVTYTLGTGRVSGDRLVASETSSNVFAVPTTLTATMKYPSSGTGATVTYIEINVYQSNDNGRAYVTSGGIDSNQIVVAVEAQKTYNFDIYFYVYGK